GVEQDGVLADLLDRGVHAPDGADAGTRLHLVPHLDGLLLLLLGRPGHQEHGPDEHNEREEGQETHGSELPSHDRAGERPVGWGCVVPPATAASAESRRVRAQGTTLSTAPGFLPGPPSPRSRPEQVPLSVSGGPGTRRYEAEVRPCRRGG